MKILNLGRYALGMCVAVAFLTGCGGGVQSFAPAQSGGALGDALRSGAPKQIQHLIIVVQQNRSFDNLFDGFPGADTVPSGECAPTRWCKSGKAPLRQITLQTNGEQGAGVTLPDTQKAFTTEWDQGKMDGFDRIDFGYRGDGPPAHLYPYAYVDKFETKPYWDLAMQYGLADHMFSTERAGSFAAGEVLVAGSTLLHKSNQYVIGVTNVGGCDAAKGTHSILANGQHGPPPCFDWKSMADLLDAANVSWKYYTLLCSGHYANAGCIWNAVEALKHVRRGADWSRNVSVPNTNIFDDLKGKNFPAVSWVTPSLDNSDDSVSGSNKGPAWVTSIVDAAKHSRYWKHTAVVVVWGDWGGYYDHVAPQHLDTISLGLRVPMLVISPYAKKGYVSHTNYELASILRFAEDNWNLGTLGNTDQRATSIANMFTF